MNRPGPPIDRGRLTVLGKYLDDALTLAEMSQSELARRAKLGSSAIISRVMSGNRTVGRETLISWCDILQTPDWLRERILNTAGFATDEQIARYSSESAVEESRRQVQEELKKR